MKKLSLLVIALSAMFFTSCDKETTMTANITWEDSEYYELDGEIWMAAMYGDAIIKWDDSDYEKSPITSKTIDFETANLSFDHEFSSSESFTIVIFADLNENGKYDMGENSGQDFEVITAGDNTNFDISVSY